MGNNVYGAIALKTSSGALDQIDGVNLLAGDVALVVTDTNSYFYKLFTNDASQENSPYIIQPVLNGSNKRWKLTSISETSGDLSVVGKLITNMISFSGNTLSVYTGSETLATFNKETNSVSFKKISSVEDSTVVQGLNAEFVGGRDGSKMMLSDGSIAFEAPVSGSDPTSNSHLATKSYIDTLISNIDLTELSNVRIIGFVNVNNIESDTDQDISIKPAGTTSVIFKTNGTCYLGGSTEANSSLAVSKVTNAVNYISASGATASNTPGFTAAGVDSNVGTFFAGKGTGSFLSYFDSHTFMNKAGASQFKIRNTSSSVNYFQVYGAATGISPTMMCGGADTNTSLRISSKGSGSIELNSDSNSKSLAVFAPTSTPVNYFHFQSGNTGYAPKITALGSDTNVGFSLTGKGTGGFTSYFDNHYFFNNAGAPQFQVSNTASAVNRLSIGGATTGNAPQFDVVGSDTNIGLNIVSKGSADVTVNGAPVRPSATARSIGGESYRRILGIICPPSLEVKAWDTRGLTNGIPSGFSFSRASTATAYGPDGQLYTAEAGKLRHEWDALTGEYKGWLLEGQATNLLLYSGDFSNAAWGKASVTATAARITGDSNASGYLDQYVSVSADAVTRVCSWRISKTSTSTNVRCSAIYLGGTLLDANIEFNPQTGVVTSATAANYGVVDRGTHWLVWIAATNNGTNTGLVPRLYPDRAGGTAYVEIPAGLGTQAEVGSYPTSYIPTTSAQVTRAADALSVDVTQYPTRADGEATYYIEFSPTRFATGGSWGGVLVLGSSSAGGTLYIFVSYTGGIWCNYLENGTVKWGAGLGTATIGQTYRIAVSLKAGAFAVSLNGNTPVTSTYASLLPPSGNIYGGNTGIVFIDYGSGVCTRTQHTMYFPRRLSNTELQLLTK